LPDKLPSLKTERAVRALEACGFKRIRQRGSHLVLERPGTTVQVVIAMHKRELGPVLVRKIITQSGLTAEEFLKHV